MKLLFGTSAGGRRARVMLVSIALSAAVGTVPALAAHLTRGFVDDAWFDPPAQGISQLAWIRKTVATGAKFAQIEVDWKSVEPRAPRHGDRLTNPAGPQFDFSALDEHVEELAHTGLEPVFLVTDAPRWAEGNGGTAAEYASGGYEPNAPAFHDLAVAMATRYSGSYPNPLRPGRSLPHVRYMQVWGEANMNIHLSPQWTRTGGRLQNTGPVIYRNLLNAFYTGVKTGDPDDVVLASGLEAYGDPPDQLLHRTRPVTFLEGLLCLTPELTRAPCPGATHFDVLASDPYDSFAPTVSAVSPLDASAPDLGRLVKVMKAGLAAHTLLPDKPKPLWVTEFGYDSDPPNRTPGTLSTATQARWLEQALYVFWHEGVSTVLWYLVRDQPPPYSVNYASGVFFRDGKPKPSYTAYRFPFVVMGSGAEAQAWGIAPVTGTVKIQLRSSRGWETVRTLRDHAGNVFAVRSSALVHGDYRATVSGQSSLVWAY